MALIRKGKAGYKPNAIETEDHVSRALTGVEFELESVLKKEIRH